MSPKTDQQYSTQTSEEFITDVLTINVSVVYMGRDVLIWMRENP